MIIVGFTEMHGIAKEHMKKPPSGVEYKKVHCKPSLSDYFITSTAKGVLRHFDDNSVDLLEAPLFPIITNMNWIHTPADFHTCANFGFCNLPLPRKLRVKFLEHIFLKKNFIKLLFKSEFGRDTLSEYGLGGNERLLSKIDVVYPAIRQIEEKYIRFKSDKINITFSGDFLRKGGMHVVDAFEELQKKYDHISLRLCTSEDNIQENESICGNYLKRIKNNPSIDIGYADRDYLLYKILPETDIFTSPTYSESYGYALEEAISYGIPVISTNHAAVPEIIEHGKSGFLINTKQFNFIRNIKGYKILKVPSSFNSYMNKKVYEYLDILIQDLECRKSMGMRGLKIARTKFSFEVRNQKMLNIYKSCGTHV